MLDYGFTREVGHGFSGLSTTPLPDITGYNISNVVGPSLPQIPLHPTPHYFLHTFVHEVAHCLYHAIQDIDVIADEDLVHDYSYHIKNGIGIDYDNLFDVRLRQAYNNAIEQNIWGDAYITKNDQEYWAELVQLWFFAVGEDRFFKTTEELEKLDPLGTALLKEWFPQVTLPWYVNVPD